SEADRLRFVAATEHAGAVGQQNPCGLFASIIRRKAWNLLSQADEDRASRRLRDHAGRAATPTRPAQPLAISGALSGLAARFGIGVGFTTSASAASGASTSPPNRGGPAR